MSIQLDHVIVPSRDAKAAAGLLANLLDVPWAEPGPGPFCPVYVNDGLTLDFDQAEGSFPTGHFCFRVSDAEFDGILSRLKSGGIAYRSTPDGPVDMQVNTRHGGRIVYWNAPEGHIWEALTVSYARQPGSKTQDKAMPEPSPFIWNELVTADQRTSGAFFAQLLGWTRKEVDAGPFGTYTLFQKGGNDVAGMMNPTPDTTGKGSFWHAYLAVDNVDECAGRARSLGGSVQVAPHDVPDFGRVCVVADPTGAEAHLVQPLKQQ